MEERYNGEVLLIEDESDFLEQSLNILMSSENAVIRMSQDSEEGFLKRDKDQIHVTGEEEHSFALLYSWPSPSADENQELLEINPDLKIIPLFLIAGPKREMGHLTRCLSGTINCFRLSVDMENFIEKAKKTPMFWGLIDSASNEAAQEPASRLLKPTSENREELGSESNGFEHAAEIREDRIE